MTTKPTPEMMSLIEAGFTAEELRALGTDLTFAAIAAGETDESFGLELSANPAVHWTPEKRAAFNALLKGKGGVRGPEES